MKDRLKKKKKKTHWFFFRVHNLPINRFTCSIADAAVRRLRRSLSKRNLYSHDFIAYIYKIPKASRKCIQR